MPTTIARYHDPIEAQLSCGRLCAEGIDAWLADAGMMLANWEWRLAVGGVRVQVEDADAERARRILQQLDAGAFQLAEHGDDAEPEIEATTLQPVYHESWSSRVAWVALMLFGVPLPWKRRHNDAMQRDA